MAAEVNLIKKSDLAKVREVEFTNMFGYSLKKLMFCILFISLPYISITIVFLHFGQNTGKFLASVSFLIFVLVLLLHICLLYTSDAADE